MADTYIVTFGTDTVEVEGKEVVEATSDEARAAVEEVLGEVVRFPFSSSDETGYVEDGFRLFRPGQRAHVYAALSMLPGAVISTEDTTEAWLLEQGFTLD